MGTDTPLYKVIGIDVLKRNFNININKKYAFLLGAGCSITSGIPSAATCIWEWKMNLYASSSNTMSTFPNIALESSKRDIQRWCDSQVGFPEEGSEGEYEFYIEKCFPFAEDRVAYFEKICTLNRKLSVGYRALGYLAKKGIIKSVWTTNFDGLTKDAAREFNVTYNEVTLETKQYFTLQNCKNNLLYVPLHGDYLQNQLKNTSAELAFQEDILLEGLSHHLTDTNLFIVGYSGRDKSLMNALKRALSLEGGNIYWFGREDTPSNNVAELLNRAAVSGRTACYVQIPGFDELMLGLLTFSGTDEETHEVIMKLKNIPEFQEPAKTKWLYCGPKNVTKVALCNQLLVVFPEECYTFKSNISDERELNRLIKPILRGSQIIARAYNGQVYAFGGYGEIVDKLKLFMSTTPERIPISKTTLRENHQIRKLYLRAILLGIIRMSGLHGNLEKCILWNPAKIFKTNFYEAVKLDLQFNDTDKYGWLIVRPTLYPIKAELAISERKNGYREYLDKLTNSLYQQKVTEWLCLMANNCRKSDILYPNTYPEFKFVLRWQFPLVKINGEGTVISGSMPSHAHFEGFQLREPKIRFSQNNGKYIDDINPMRGLIRYQPFDIPSHLLPHTTIRIGVICPTRLTQVAYNFLDSLNNKATQIYKDYIQDFPGFGTAFKTSLSIPSPTDKTRWIKCSDKPIVNHELGKKICSVAQKIAHDNPDTVVMIFVPSDWKIDNIKESNGEELNLHDYIKAHCAQNHYTVQFIQEKTLYALNSNYQKARILWWISLAIFVKSGRIPWSLASLEPHSAYAGIGYSLKKTPNNKMTTVLGCSHLYDHFGQGLNFRLRQIKDAVIDNHNNPYLSEDEAYNLGLSIIELFRDSSQRNPKRLVIHKRTPFKEQEIKGLVSAVRPYVEEIELISIEREKSLRLISGSTNGNEFNAGNNAIERGMCQIVSDFEALIWTQGCIASVAMPNKLYYPGNKGIPGPLRIRRHYGKGDIRQIASEILSFTKINWNSFDFYSSFPATIESSNLVARIGTKLQHYEGNTFDFKYFI